MPPKPIYLRTLREQRCLSQVQLKALSGVAQNTISKLEGNPDSRPVFATVVALATALRVDPLRLRFGPDPRAPYPRPKRRGPTVRSGGAPVETPA